MTRLGGWLFRHRTVIPIPLAIPLLFIRIGESSASLSLVWAGLGLIALGEAIRLWGVHHIGAISRTRSDRLGPLIDDGPFALVRNPLYVGNITLWAGFAVLARMLWMAPVVVVLLGFEYHAIVRWEEQLLASRLGDAYRNYLTRVPRWIPTFNRRAHRVHGEPSVGSVTSVVSFSWRQTFFSERGTLIAIAVGCAALWIKLS